MRHVLGRASNILNAIIAVVAIVMIVVNFCVYTAKAIWPAAKKTWAQSKWVWSHRYQPTPYKPRIKVVK